MNNFEIMLIAQHIEEFLDHAKYAAAQYLDEMGVTYRDVEDLEFEGKSISIQFTLPGCGCCQPDREWTSMPTSHLWKDECMILK